MTGRDSIVVEQTGGRYFLFRPAADSVPRNPIRFPGFFSFPVNPVEPALNQLDGYETVAVQAIPYTVIMLAFIRFG
jgi:hypothetical protein